MNTNTLGKDGYFPPPWNPYEYPEKTEGWIAFQEAMKKDPGYYLVESNEPLLLELRSSNGMKLWIDEVEEDKTQIYED